MKFLITLMIVTGLYSAIIGLIINAYCFNKVFYYCWENHNNKKAEEWLKYQRWQLVAQISSFAVFAICLVIFGLITK